MTFVYDEPGFGRECSKSADSIITYLQSSTVYTYQPEQLFAPTIQIAWQRSDIARWNAPATSAPTSSILVSSTASPGAATSGAAAASAGLSTSAKAGIGIGAAAAGLIVVVAIVSLVSRRRRKARNVPQDPHHNIIAGPQHPEPRDNGKRHSGVTTLQNYPSPVTGYQSPSLVYQSPPQGYHNSPQEYQTPL